jgi:homospermidine synthase
VLLLGASGGVSNAFLHYLAHHRDYFNKLVLLDRLEGVLHDPYIDHKRLDYTFIKYEISLPKNHTSYIHILKKYHIDIVIDLTDYDTIPIIQATNEAGSSYINTAMCDKTKLVSEMIFDMYARKDSINNATHILCTGMNPGVVNMWVRHGIQKFGKPNEIIHFEYDTSSVVQNWKFMMTWSLREYIIESIEDPSGKMLGKNNLQQLHPCALSHRVDMKPFLEPILKLDRYPRGFQVLHEENCSIAQKYDIPSQFVYAVNLKTMDTLVELYKEKHKFTVHDLILGDNTSIFLDGADSIGVILEYDDKKVYYFNTEPNISVIGTNGTYTQVVVGIFSALFTLLKDKLDKKIYFL